MAERINLVEVLNRHTKKGTSSIVKCWTTGNHYVLEWVIGEEFTKSLTKAQLFGYWSLV